MTVAQPDDLTDLERWALDDGFMTVEEVLAHRQEDGIRAAGLGLGRRPAADGRDILAGLRDRGLTVRLGDDGRPRVGPRHLVDDADLTILAEHRAAVLAALRAERGDAT